MKRLLFAILLTAPIAAYADSAASPTQPACVAAIGNDHGEHFPGAPLVGERVVIDDGVRNVTIQNVDFHKLPCIHFYAHGRVVIDGTGTPAASVPAERP